MKAKKILPVILVALVLILVGTIAITTAFSKPDENLMCEGVSIGDIDVSGMTIEEAKQKVNSYIETLQNKTVTIKIENEEVTATLKELGYGWNVEESLSEAMLLGKDDNFMKRYQVTKELESNGISVPVEMTVDETKIRDFIESECTKFDVEPENASLSRQNGVFIVTEQKSGRKLSVEDTFEVVKEYLKTVDLKSDVVEHKMEVEAVVVDAQPEHTTEMASLCKDLLGTFSTSYASSSASRANNLSNGAKLLNGAIIWPGETYSAGQNLNPITIENGYSMGSAYENGKVVDSIGGGVCQVTTTFYNALLFAELEIVERSNHSMTVSYVKPAMDAAIAGTYKDLKFKNNTDAPVYIEAITVGRTITFKIYGHETRPANRTLKFESKVIEEIQPGAEKVTKDPTLPSTYRKVTQSAHKGYRAQLWKVIYENGVEVSREQVNSSYYAATPTHVTVGTKENKVEKPQTDNTTTPSTNPDTSVEEKPTTNPDTNVEEKPSTNPDTSVEEKPSTNPDTSTSEKPSANTDTSASEKPSTNTEPSTSEKPSPDTNTGNSNETVTNPQPEQKPEPKPETESNTGTTETQQPENTGSETEEDAVG